MISTTLARTNVPISAIGLGGMPLSIQGRPPDDEGRRVIHAAIDAGVTFIDTADVYCLNDGDLGHNERLIASAIRQRRDRDSIHIATKAGLRRPGGQWTRDGTPKHIREACEQSLRALGVEEIWLYQFHAPDPSVPFGESIEALLYASWISAPRCGLIASCSSSSDPGGTRRRIEYWTGSTWSTSRSRAMKSSIAR